MADQSWSCTTCRHHIYSAAYGGGYCWRFPKPEVVPQGYRCGEWSSTDGRSMQQMFTHEALTALTKAQAALARAAYALREAGKGTAAEAAHRAANEAQQAIEAMA